MSSVSVFKLFVSTIFIAVAQARKTYLVKAEPMAAYQPTVRAYTC